MVVPPGRWQHAAWQERLTMAPVALECLPTRTPTTNDISVFRTLTTQRMIGARWTELMSCRPMSTRTLLSESRAWRLWGPGDGDPLLQQVFRYPVSLMHSLPILGNLSSTRISIESRSSGLSRRRTGQGSGLRTPTEQVVVP